MTSTTFSTPVLSRVGKDFFGLDPKQCSDFQKLLVGYHQWRTQLIAADDAKGRRQPACNYSCYVYLAECFPDAMKTKDMKTPAGRTIDMIAQLNSEKAYKLHVNPVSESIQKKANSTLAYAAHNVVLQKNENVILEAAGCGELKDIARVAKAVSSPKRNSKISHIYLELSGFDKDPLTIGRGLTPNRGLLQEMIDAKAVTPDADSLFLVSCVYNKFDITYDYLARITGYDPRDLGVIVDRALIAGHLTKRGDVYDIRVTDGFDSPFRIGDMNDIAAYRKATHYNFNYSMQYLEDLSLLGRLNTDTYVVYGLVPNHDYLEMTGVGRRVGKYYESKDGVYKELYRTKKDFEKAGLFVMEGHFLMALDGARNKGVSAYTMSTLLVVGMFPSKDLGLSFMGI